MSKSTKKGIFLTLNDKNKVTMSLRGELSLDEMLDLLNTGIYMALNDILSAAETAHKESPHKHDFKTPIYERAVWGFSLMMDKFHPEMKESKYHGLREEAIMKAEDALLKERAHGANLHRRGKAKVPPM